MHTIKSINQFIEEHLTSAIRSKFSAEKLIVEIEGVIGEVKQETEYRYYYGVKLKDDSGYVLLDIPRDIIAMNKITGGEYVNVTGALKTKLDNYTGNRVEFRIDVSNIKLVETPQAIEAHKKEQATIAKIHSLHPGRKVFPYKGVVKMSLILSKTSQVEDDFMNELKEFKDALIIERKVIDITSKESIINAINESSGNILAIIRGGGDDQQFEVFNQMSVIESLAKKDAYRLLGLGHTNDSTLIELVSDFSASTPTQAGAHIREMMSTYQAKTNEIIALRDLLQKKNNPGQPTNATSEGQVIYKNISIILAILTFILILILIIK